MTNMAARLKTYNFGESTLVENHSVRFYTSEGARIRDIANVVIESLLKKEAVLLACSTENRDLVMTALGRRFSAAENERIHFIDSQWAIEKIFENGQISPELFRAHVCGKVRALIRQYGNLHVYSDIVDDLMANGHQQAVLDLEVEWHKAIEETPFYLHCGYLMEHFSSISSASVFEEICRMHSSIEDDFADEKQNLPRELSISRAMVLQQQLATQRELMAKERLAMIGELSATVSNELNSPLATILFSTDGIRSWMNSQDLAPAQKSLLDAHLRRTESAALRMVSINRNMLSFSRESNAHLNTFCLQDVARQSLDRLAVRITCTGIELKVELHDSQEPLLLYGSSIGIEQVILNLVSNSIEAILEKREEHPKHGGKIVVEVRRVNATTAQLVVRDNGSGISQADQEHLFQPFFTTKTPGQGTGLGLTFIQKTIQQHGGSVTVESLLGDGCRFTCSLPIAVR